MKNNKIILPAIILLILVLAAFFYIRFGQGEEQVVQTPAPQASEHTSWPIANQGGVSFGYPPDLNTAYIHTQDWPPQVRVVDEPYKCQVQDKTVERRVNGWLYCITTESEGAAGSTYTKYVYTFAPPSPEALFLAKKTVSLTFTLRQPQCANYDDPQKTACLAEERSYSVDLLADSMAWSVR